MFSTCPFDVVRLSVHLFVRSFVSSLPNLWHDIFKTNKPI